MIHSHTICQLGEGPLWLPERRALLWFDIIGQKMLIKPVDEDGEEDEWQFDEHVSAAGRVDVGRVILASETALQLFDLDRGESEFLAPLESESDTNRSNDGRADPQGGFWIGTMSKTGKKNAGAIYRYYRGEMRRLFPKLSTPNAICFAPDGGHAYFADTPVQKIWRVALDGDGWPKSTPEVFLDLGAEDLKPDGAVTDAAGNLWVAQWGAARVAGYTPDGKFLQSLDFPAMQTSCPAFGGDNLDRLFVTSARQGLGAEAGQDDGKTFIHDLSPHNIKGREEPVVSLA